MTSKNSPFHDGELVLQQESGVVERMDKMGRVLLRDHIIDQHKEFFENLPYAFIALKDAAGSNWATLVQGYSGFMSVPQEKQLHVDAKPLASTELNLQMSANKGIGVLGLDLTNRRRNRLNGHLAEDSDTGLLIDVQHSFGNCPKYIQTRSPVAERTNDPEIEQELTELSADMIQLIRNCDTFFIASAESNGADSNLDMSHRGGKPGFVTVGQDNTLEWLDYPGNNLYQTFGNIVVNPDVGLLFLEFESGDACLLNGSAQIDTVGGSQEEGFIQRRVSFKLNRGRLVRNALQQRWALVENSPFLPEL